MKNQIPRLFFGSSSNTATLGGGRKFDQLPCVVMVTRDYID